MITTHSIYRLLVLCSLCVVFLACSTSAMANKQGNANVVNKTSNETALLLEQISLKIDDRISKMQLIAKSIANDPHIHDWVDNGFNQKDEALLLKKLRYFVDEYQLTSASFADKNTNKYWNHEGFLRVLDTNIDTWYFNYLKSGSQDLISVYHDKNKHRVDIYVNYQQLGGNGLSGIATSFNGVLDMLASSPLASEGELLLVAPDGAIKLSSSNTIKENTLIQNIYKHALLDISFKSKPNDAQQSMTSPKKASIVKLKQIPHMTWYLVFVKA